METKLDVREKKDLLAAINNADTVVFKKYLSNMQNYNIIPIDSEIEDMDLNKIARFYKVEQFVYDKNENNHDKLISVFQSIAAIDASFIILIDGTKEGIDYYIGVRSVNSNVADAHDVLFKSLSGNFPGIVFKNYSEQSNMKNYTLSKTELNNLTKRVFEFNELNRIQEKSVASITGIAGLRSDKENKEQKFVQGLEKVIDAMRGERYSMLLIADPITITEIQTMQRAYENLYSSLKPFETSDLTFSRNESESVMNTLATGITDTLNESTTNTITNTKGTNQSYSHTHSDTKGLNINGTVIGAGVGFLIGGPLGAGIGGFVGSTISANTSKTNSDSETFGTSQSKSISEGRTFGSSYATSETKSEGKTTGLGSSQSLLIKSENKAIKNLLEKIDLQTKRLYEAQSIGMWNFSAYCIADNDIIANTGAATYQSVIRGEKSYLESGSITLWKNSNLRAVKKYLSKMMHPIIQLNENKIPISSLVNTKELTIHSIFPEKSVSGLAVKTMASFGREVIFQEKNHDNDSLKLGFVYHMGQKEDKQIALNKNNLTAHTFITGATGSGKSNTIYKMLNEAQKQGVNFLVVEPAKGEYKHVFGNDDSVSVYGTNPNLTPLLKINPFSFPKEIHILEHLDRLVELFNVCWPMYAAMPAVLKEAIEKSYKDAGWNLTTSTNAVNENLLPTFKDVMNNIKVIINTSEYSEENKGNYKGALVTRLKSLTNGINGMIFVNNEISANDLFDKNVIIDLSRVGSTETKSLIMGLLVMKLQEHRMTEGKLNSKLSHITVLEEAHNLLKRTSTEQISEGSNLLGKSVEMLANAIAEMRTYGEGFIIADQSPGLLDMAVIRNTNTKIIMRTPDFSDRELVGKAAGLNDDQIIEIGKLPRGVAAVYQNNWIEPVLCSVDYYYACDSKYENKEQFNYSRKEDENLICNLSKYLLSDILEERIDINIDELKDKLIYSSINAEAKKDILHFLNNNYLPKNVNEVYHIISLLHQNSVQIADIAIEKSSNPEEWNSRIASEVTPKLFSYEANYQAVILQCIIYELSKQNKAYEDIPHSWTEFMQGGKTV